MQKSALRERLMFDLGPAGVLPAGLLYGSAATLRALGKDATAFWLLMKTHSAAFSPQIDRRILLEIRDATAAERAGQSTGLRALYDRTVRDAVAAFRRAPGADPLRLIGSRIFVIKSAADGEKGVLVADYNYMLPLLAGLFDLEVLARKYFIVLEPGWNGYCTPDVLLYSFSDAPVFVQTIEPRDREVLETIGAPFQAIFPTSTNCWVDYRFTKPLPEEQRDIDVIMVAAWANFKRHWRFFQALSVLRSRGRRLKVALVGYRYDRTQEDILRDAKHFGVDDQLQFFERISQREVSELLCRSKVHVIWSRREGSNRAMIEAMMADVPTIVRQGFNFGYQYPHINPQTGRFVAEPDLADAMADMIDNRHRYSAREWAMAHMTCQRATAVMEAAIQARAVEMGEPWTRGLVVKTSNLDGQQYWDPADREKFAGDYRFLESIVRRN